MSHLFMVSLGPVQDFIASARRSRDLWFGSWLLSELSKSAARELVRIEGGQLACLIFPAPEHQTDLEFGSQFNVANKVLARVTHSPSDVGDRVKEAVHRRIMEISGQVLDRLDLPPNLKDRAIAQIKDLPEVYWVSLPLTDESHYRQVRQQLEALMQARKLTRNFLPSTWGDHCPKSSLDGQRESVIPEQVLDEVRQKKVSENDLFRNYGVRPGERLCGVGLLKRHGVVKRHQSLSSVEERPEHLEHAIFSTSHFAALPTIRRMETRYKDDSQIHIKVKAFIETLKGHGILEEHLQTLPETDPRRRRFRFWIYDGRILFASRYPELFGIGVASDSGRDTLKATTESLTKLLREVAEVSSEPNPYYAIIHADGDHMGTVIDRYGTISEHQRLSQTLAKFAAKALDIVEECDGRLIYSGGDDVLAFVPLHRVVDCVESLSNSFYEQMKEFHDGQGLSPTLSSGVAIVHFMEPLCDGLELAREAERLAKGVPGKNGLAITLSKRGGVDRRISGKQSELTARLRALANLHRQEAVPDGLAYELEALQMRLASRTGEQADALSGLLLIEAERIIKRKRAEGGGRTVKESDRETLLQLLTDPRKHDAANPLQVLVDSLIVASNIAKAQDTALCDLQSAWTSMNSDESQVLASSESS